MIDLVCSFHALRDITETYIKLIRGYSADFASLTLTRRPEEATPAPGNRIGQGLGRYRLDDAGEPQRRNDVQ
jgi:hypothetical protein